MLFKWPSKTKPLILPETPQALPAPTDWRTPLPAETLTRACDETALGFTTTGDIEPLTELPGAGRAEDAIRLALDARGPGLHVFVRAPDALASTDTLSAILGGMAERDASRLADWVYVTNFSEPHGLRALRLPAGRGQEFTRTLDAALQEVAASLAAAFDSEDYRARRAAIEEEARTAADDALDALRRKAQQQNVAILRTPLGFAVAPMHDGRVVKPDVFNQLPQSMRREVESRVTAFQEQLEELLASAPGADAARRARLFELNRDIATEAIERSLDALSMAFAEVGDVAQHLVDLEADLVASAGTLLAREEARYSTRGADLRADAAMQRYRALPVVLHDAKAPAPLVVADAAALDSLAGTVCAMPHGGLAIRAGVLHRANGGVLLLHARCVLDVAGCATALVRALASGTVRLAVPPDGPTVEPIPLDLRVIMIGTDGEHQRLIARDDRIADHFPIVADLDGEVVRSCAEELLLARRLAAFVRAQSLLPLAASGAARLIEESARVARDPSCLAVSFRPLTQLARAADSLARADGRTTIERGDIDAAHRAARMRLRRTPVPELPRVCVYPATGRTLEVLGAGAALAHRLTAFLAARYGDDAPLALGVSIDGVPAADDGLPAALAAAVLAQLAEAALPNDAVLLGDIDPRGALLPMPDATAAIEAVCDAALAGSEASALRIIMPRASLDRLMLRADLVDAVREKEITVFAVASIDEALELMTGLAPGGRDAKRRYPNGSLNGRAVARISAFAERLAVMAGGKTPGRPA